MQVPNGRWNDDMCDQGRVSFLRKTGQFFFGPGNIPRTRDSGPLNILYYTIPKKEYNFICYKRAYTENCKAV